MTILQQLYSRAKHRFAGHPLRLFTATLKAGLCFHLFFEHVYSIEPTAGASMLPTLEVAGDEVLISKRYRRGRDIKVGDIIAFQSVIHPGEKVIKRVLGMPGDYVLRDTPGTSQTMIQIPEGHCWVVGDNLPYSRDSRHFGPVPLALIRGKVLASVSPWSERRWLDKGLQFA